MGHEFSCEDWVKLELVQEKCSRLKSQKKNRNTVMSCKLRLKNSFSKTEEVDLGNRGKVAAGRGQIG